VRSKGQRHLLQHQNCQRRIQQAVARNRQPNDKCEENLYAPSRFSSMERDIIFYCSVQELYSCYKLMKSCRSTFSIQRFYAK
jgi:hypothetical protein